MSSAGSAIVQVKSLDTPLHYSGPSTVPYLLCVWGHVAYFCLIDEEGEEDLKKKRQKKRKRRWGESGFPPLPFGLFAFIVFIYLFRNVSKFNDYVSLFVAVQFV